MTSNVVEFIKTLLLLSDKTQRVLICKRCRMFFVYLNTISLFCLVPFQLYTDILSFLVDRHKLPLRRKSRIMRKGGICRTVSVFGHIVPQGHLGKPRVAWFRFLGVCVSQTLTRFQFDWSICQPRVHKAILLVLLLWVKAIMKDHIIGGILDWSRLLEGMLDHTIFKHCDRDHFRFLGKRI